MEWRLANLVSNFSFSTLIACVCVDRMHRTRFWSSAGTRCWPRSWYWCRKRSVAGITDASSRRCSPAASFCRLTCAATSANSDIIRCHRLFSTKIHLQNHRCHCSSSMKPRPRFWFSISSLMCTTRWLMGIFICDTGASKGHSVHQVSGSSTDLQGRTATGCQVFWNLCPPMLTKSNWVFIWIYCMYHNELCTTLVMQT